MLTHASLLLMTVCYFGLLLWKPFWLVFVPAVLLAHRIGVMLHEYIHGIPLRRYRDCLAIVSLFDGLLLLFGLLELFRGTHLAHHSWLNREGDPGFEQAKKKPPAKRLLALVSALEIMQYFALFWRSVRGGVPFVKGRRVALGAALSAGTVIFWLLIGRPEMVWKLIAISAFTASVPVSLRGAIEHHGRSGDSGFANEYRVLIPLFNLNRHIHHHEEPGRPWYLLEFRQQHPLNERHYFTHWFHVYVRKDFVLMKPRAQPQRLVENPR